MVTDAGVVMISSQAMRIARGKYSESAKRALRLSRGTWKRTNSWAKEMCRASSAMWISMVRSTAGGRLPPARSSAFW